LNLDKLTPEQKLAKYQEWGIVDTKAKFAGVDQEGNILISSGVTDTQPQAKQDTLGNVLGIGKDLAIGLVPIIGTAYFWKGSKWYWNAASIAGDVLFFIPVVKGVSAGVRSGQTLAKAVGKVALAELKAPVTIFTRPKATAKATIQPIIETISPKHIPIESAEIRDFILKLGTKRLGSEKTALEARDMLTVLAETGKKPRIEIAGKDIELTTTALQQRGQGVTVHTGYDMSLFMEGATVSGGEGGQLFLAPNIISRYFPHSASGKGFVPAPNAGIFEWTNRNIDTISKYRPEEIAKLDLPVIRNVDFSDAVNIPKNVAPVLENLSRKYNATLYGSYGEWLRGSKVKANDLDLVVKRSDVIKFKNEAKLMLNKLGYSDVDISGTAIKLNKKPVADIHPEDHFMQWRNKASSGVPPELIKLPNGLSAIPLGEQYLLQGFGAVEGGAKAAKRTQKVLKMSPKIMDLIKEAGYTKKMPGALIIRDEEILKQLRSSGKLYKTAAEIESVLKEGVKLPKPSQTLKMIDSTGETATLLIIGKPFTKAEIAKFKLMGNIDMIRDLWRPAIKIDNKAVQELDDVSRETKTLQRKINIAQQSGNTQQVNSLRRDYEALTQRARAIAKRIDAGVAGGALSRAIVSFGDFTERINFRELARSEPAKLAREIVDMPRAEVNRVLAEVPKRDAVRVRSEIDKIERIRTEQRIDSSRVREADRIRTPDRTRVTDTVRADVTDRVPPPERVPTPDRVRVPTTDRIPPPTGRIPPTDRTPTPVPPRRISPPPPPRRPPPPEKVPPPIIVFKFKSGKTIELTKSQIDGAVAWKQGVMYKMFIPGTENGYQLINTPNPIPGVRIEKGMGAAARSIVLKHGDLPKDIKWDMGIMDIEISRAKQGNKPKIRFTEDKYSRTKTSKNITKVKIGR
jgi:hypothetical protein